MSNKQDGKRHEGLRSGLGDHVVSGAAKSRGVKFLLNQRVSARALGNFFTFVVPDIHTTFLSAEGTRCKPLCYEEDDSTGAAGRGATHGERVAAEVRPPGGGGQPPILLPHALAHHYLHDTAG